MGAEYVDVLFSPVSIRATSTATASVAADVDVDVVHRATFARSSAREGAGGGFSPATFAWAWTRAMASWVGPTPMMGARVRRETFARRAWTRGTSARAWGGVRGASDAMVSWGAFARARRRARATAASRTGEDGGEYLKRDRWDLCDV